MWKYNNKKGLHKDMTAKEKEWQEKMDAFKNKVTLYGQGFDGSLAQLHLFLP